MPCIRIKDLSSTEIRAFLRMWETKAEEALQRRIKIVIARDGADYPECYLADEEKSITYYRNTNESGLIYIQTKVESDEQGLESMFTIRDRNFLDGTFDEMGFRARNSMVLAAWREAAGEERLIPALLPPKLVRALEALHPAPMAVSVRAFSAFALDAARAVAAERGATDEDTVSRRVGESLFRLGIFPDAEWEAPRTDQRIRRRLQANYYHSELASPAGSEVDPDVLADKARVARFQRADGTPFPEKDQEEWRNRCGSYCETRAEPIRREIPYRIFEQLFSKDVVGERLGSRIRSELEVRAPTRVVEFDALDIEQGLSEGSSEDARRFLETDPKSDQEDDRPLRELLSTRTRKMVERLAYPPAKPFNNPLLQLVEFVHKECAEELESRSLGSYTVALTLGPSPEGADTTATLGLFAFLFGPTLQSLSEASAEDGAGMRLSIDERLLAPRTPPDLRGDDDEDPVEWLPLPLIFELRDSAGVPIATRSNQRWSPSPPAHWLALLWLFAVCEDSPTPSFGFVTPSGEGIHQWVASAAARLVPLNSLETRPVPDGALADPLLRGVIDARLEFIRGVRDGGLSQQILDSYIERWSGLLRAAKETLVPTGAADPRLDAFLGMDTIVDNNARIVLLLALHPFRLRWLAASLREHSRIMLDVLAGELSVSEENDGLYFDFLKALSPHRLPPLVAAGRTLYVPTEELGWSELYAPIQSGGSSSPAWTAGVDDSSIEVLALEVEEYLRAHPHKCDGLVITTVLPAGGDFPARLVARIRTGEYSKVPVTCHVVAAQEHWTSIGSAFEKLETGSRVVEGVSLLPPVDLRLHSVSTDGEPPSDLRPGSVDLAIVPNFFGARVEVLQQTEKPFARPGRFHELHDRTSYVDRETTAGSVSIVLRPFDADEMLDSWSSLCVRQERLEPIQSDAPGNTDYVKLRVMFEQESRLFEWLHAIAHWVMTLDAYVGREQIESLRCRPDILTVKEGVGANSFYTIVVSSNAGREFVIDRIERKLRTITSTTRAAGLEGGSHGLAESIYKEVRDVSPHLMLRAMGLSRVTEEILGLMVAKRLAGERFPLPDDCQFAAWVALDEHLEWFGGDVGTRADLCRLTFSGAEGRLRVGALVVEGKLRKAWDRHGVEQVNRTAKILAHALRGGSEALDARLWRKELLAAVDATSEAARHLPSGQTGIPATVREDFREGNFDLEGISGVYSICLQNTTQPPSWEEIDGVDVVCCPGDEVLDVLGIRLGTRAASQVDAARGEVEEPHITPAVSGAVGPHQEPQETQARGRLGAEMLEARYQTVLDTFAEFGVKVLLPEGTRFIEGPASVLFRLRPGQGVSEQRIFERDQSLKLRLGLPEEASIRFSIDRGAVSVDVPKADSERYFVVAQEIWGRWEPPDRSHLCVPIGESRRGEIVYLDFSSPNSPHLLIGGTTGSGKSEALKTILRGATHYYGPDVLRLHLVDPKGTELQDFAGSSHLQGDIGWDDSDAARILIEAVEEMQRRYEMFKRAGCRSLAEFNATRTDPTDILPWWLIVLDEYADLTSDPDVKREIERHLKRLAQKGRAAGIHVIIATQKPSAEVISTNLRSNLPAQLALRVRSGIESRVIMDETGAEALSGKGDAFFRAEGRIERVQCAIVREGATSV